LHAPGSGGVTGARTTFVTVPLCVSKIGPVGVVSKNVIGSAALVPVIEPCVRVVPLNRYSPVPVTLPSFEKSPPTVIAPAACVSDAPPLFVKANVPSCVTPVFVKAPLLISPSANSVHEFDS
jgi:hypothetical protein